MRKHLNIFLTETKQTCLQRGQMCATALNLILFDSRERVENWSAEQLWIALHVHTSDLMSGYGGEKFMQTKYSGVQKMTAHTLLCYRNQ